MSISKRVNFIGSLSDLIQLAQVNTISHADELVADCEDRDMLTVTPSLFYNLYMVMDTALFTIEGGELCLYFGRGAINEEIINPVLRHLAGLEGKDELAKMYDEIGNRLSKREWHGKRLEFLHKAQDYQITKQDIERIFDSVGSGIRKFRVSDIVTRIYPNTGYAAMEIPTHRISRITKEQRQFAEDIWQQDNQFDKTMSWLRDAGVKEAVVTFPTYRTVEKELSKRGAPAYNLICNFWEYDVTGCPSIFRIEDTCQSFADTWSLRAKPMEQIGSLLEHIQIHSSVGGRYLKKNQAGGVFHESELYTLNLKGLALADVFVINGKPCFRHEHHGSGPATLLSEVEALVKWNLVSRYGHKAAGFKCCTAEVKYEPIKVTLPRFEFDEPNSINIIYLPRVEVKCYTAKEH